MWDIVVIGIVIMICIIVISCITITIIIIIDIFIIYIIITPNIQYTNNLNQFLLIIFIPLTMYNLFNLFNSLICITYTF